MWSNETYEKTMKSREKSQKWADGNKRKSEKATKRWSDKEWRRKQGLKTLVIDGVTYGTYEAAMLAGYSRKSISNFVNGIGDIKRKAR